MIVDLDCEICDKQAIRSNDGTKVGFSFNLHYNVLTCV
jgi:hypothetical protein